MTRREFEKMNEKVVRFLGWLTIIVLIWLFLYTIQTLYTINFQKGVRACMQTTGLNLNECKDLAK